MVVTRFAPSPTGFLHIGGARTALFNYLYAKNKNGKFLLRVEDTDLKRSTKEAKEAILSGLKWLGLNWDEKEVYQSENLDRHKQIAEKLVKEGKAYYCYTSKEELDALREEAVKNKQTFKYPHIWRDKNAEDAPKNIDPVVRIKVPLTGKITIKDEVQGEVTLDYKDIDDFVIMRADGTPTYMLSVVVDDIDMRVTHIIRGDDHLTNSFKQKVIFDHLNIKMPICAHIPLIHGADGAKLSKRHGALGVEAYKEMGYLPEAICNYLLRLGWSHGDDEIISKENAIKWFDLKHLGKSPSRFDFTKLNFVNAHYLKQKSADEILELLQEYYEILLDENSKQALFILHEEINSRVSTLKEYLTEISFIFNLPDNLSEKAIKILDDEGLNNLKLVYNILEYIDKYDWNDESIDNGLREYSKNNDVKLGKLMMPLRAAITMSDKSPNLVKSCHALGREETLKRIKNRYN